MTKENIEKILEKVDWQDVHEKMVFSDFGTKICIWEDGSIVELGQNETFSEKGWEGNIGVLKAWGIGNIDSSEYLDGWGTIDEETGEFTTETGERISQEKAVRAAIENGDWSYLYEGWREELLQQWEEEQVEKEIFGKTDE